MSAPNTWASRKRASDRFRQLAVMLGAGAVVAGAVFLGIAFMSGVEETEPQVPPLPDAVKYRGDPGFIYDRPIVSVHIPDAVPPTAVPTVAAITPPLRDKPYQMVISRIGVNGGVFPYGLDENRIPLVPLNPWDIAWYTFSAQPGTGSNSVFAGHVTWNGAAVFYRLSDIALGDTIALKGEDGTELVYTVSESFMVDANDPNALALMGPTPADMLTIITCDGSFYYTGDATFGGDYTDRRVVRATLTSVNAVSQPAPPAG